MNLCRFVVAWMWVQMSKWIECLFAGVDLAVHQLQYSVPVESEELDMVESLCSWHAVRREMVR